MATKRELIYQAFGEIGIAAYEFDANADQLEAAKKRLDRLAAQWDGIGIRVGYNFAGELDDESGIPDTAEEPFAQNLAVRIAGGYGKTVSADTRTGAASGFNTLYVANKGIPTMQQPSRLPRGTGQKGDVLNPQYFGPESSEVDGIDAGATDY